MTNENILSPQALKLLMNGSENPDLAYAFELAARWGWVAGRSKNKTPNESINSIVQLQANAKKTFLTVRQLSENYPAFKENGIRFLLFNSKTNGFESCVQRVGRRVLIDAEKFEQWVSSRGI